jgi:hypothetical protein
LRECFITANVSPLTRLASLAGLGMAAPRRASAWSSHFREKCDGERAFNEGKKEVGQYKCWREVVGVRKLVVCVLLLLLLLGEMEERTQ